MAETPGIKIVEDGEVAEKSAYVRKTDREIKDLAFEVRAGQVFGSWMLRESELQYLPMVFMPLIALDDLGRKRLMCDGVLHFYGHMKDSAPRSINGMPMFFSMGFLNAEDAARIDVALKKLEDFLGNGDG